MWVFNPEAVREHIKFVRNKTHGETHRALASEAEHMLHVLEIAKELPQPGKGSKGCHGCAKVWGHHLRGEIGTVCMAYGEKDDAHPYGPACHPQLKQPGGSE
jgi:hypothetical protein